MIISPIHKAAAYEPMWAYQRAIQAEVAAGHQPPTVLLVEHQAVYTAGRRTQPHERPQDGTPVVDVDRGGKITWHGPGQLVAYPIIPLRVPIDLVAYVRTLEQVVIDVCEELGLAPIRVSGRSGVWFAADSDRPERKVCAIGIRVAAGVTMHGLALNCDIDLSQFERIIPCGISDAAVTSLTAELGRPFSIDDAQPRLEAALRHRLPAVTGTAPVFPHAVTALGSGGPQPASPPVSAPAHPSAPQPGSESDLVASSGLAVQ